MAAQFICARIGHTMFTNARSSMTALPACLLDALTDTLGADGVDTGDAIAPHHHTDWSGIEPRRPLALLRPASTAQVARVLRLCHAHRVPVVPQGGMTGLAGGAVPTPGAVALSLERMNAIENTDAIAGALTCQAGATLQAVQEAAQAAGCGVGMDLGARGSCQIGGNLATNASGNEVVQFGMMREQTLGLEVVLADGTVLDAVLPQSKAQAAALWHLREAAAEIPVRMRPINFDISLPLQAIGEFAERCVQALSARWPSQHSVRFGHLGDGNLHLSTDAWTLGCMEFDEAAQAVEALVYTLVAQASGSVSAEHGIGLHKKPYLNASRSPAEVAVMRAIKQALDPLHLLNPGKVFDPA